MWPALHSRKLLRHGENKATISRYRGEGRGISGGEKRGRGRQDGDNVFVHTSRQPDNDVTATCVSRAAGWGPSVNDVVVTSLSTKHSHKHTRNYTFGFN